MQEFKIKIILSVVAFIVVIDLYAWQGLKTLLRRRKPRTIRNWKRLHFGVTIAMSLFFMMGFFFASLETNTVYRTYTSAFIFIIYISKLIFCLFLLVDDIARGIRWIFSRKHVTTTDPAPQKNEEPTGISRAQFLSQAGAITGAIPLIILSKGILKGAYDYRIHRIPMYLKNLPFAFEGLRIVQLSDIHTGSLFDKDSVQRGIRLAMAERPDIVFFTGDLVNNQTDEAYGLMDHFAEVKAPMGVYSTFGNHDYGDYIQWSSEEAKAKNLSDLVTVHKDMGWNLLRNEHVLLERGGNRIGLVGVENWGDRGRFQKFGNVETATMGMPDVSTKILLSHDPSHFDAIVSKQNKDIDLTLSGHTHGFQFGIETPFVKWSPSQYIYPHWAGLYRENNQQLYVNRGFGFLGYPGRVGILPEITVFELRRA